MTFSIKKMVPKVTIFIGYLDYMVEKEQYYESLSIGTIDNRYVFTISFYVIQTMHIM